MSQVGLHGVSLVHGLASPNGSRRGESSGWLVVGWSLRDGRRRRLRWNGYTDGGASVRGVQRFVERHWIVREYHTVGTGEGDAHVEKGTRNQVDHPAVRLNHHEPLRSIKGESINDVELDFQSLLHASQRDDAMASKVALIRGHERRRD